MHVCFHENLPIPTSMLHVLMDMTAQGFNGVQLAECRVTGHNQFVLRPSVTPAPQPPNKYWHFDAERFQKDWIKHMEDAMGNQFQVVPLRGTMYGFTLIERREFA